MERIGRLARLGLMAAWVVAGAAAGQDAEAPSGTAPAVPPAAAPVAPPAAGEAPARRAEPPAAALRVLSATSDRPEDPGAVRLGDRLTVTVSDLGALLARVGGDCQAIVLFLDGVALPGTRAESCDLAARQVRFWLLRSDDDDRHWHALLGSPRGFRRRIDVSVGSNAEFPLPTAVQEFSLVVLPRLGFYGFVALLVLGVALVVRLARRTDMLRSSTVRTGSGRRPPFSLARSQMALWFFLVLAAYVFIWLVTEELDTISESVLGLIGIGSGTALGAAVIDAGRGPVTAPERSASGRFMKDVLEGPTGMSFHRFQMLAWTAVLGVMFCVSVYRTLAMPEFSPSLLALMGISSGTYLGFKFPENQAAGREGGAADGPPAATPEAASPGERRAAG
jgi:hypothetical protein